jgi:hypothetical protein
MYLEEFDLCQSLNNMKSLSFNMSAKSLALCNVEIETSMLIIFNPPFPPQNKSSRRYWEQLQFLVH